MIRRGLRRLLSPPTRGGFCRVTVRDTDTGDRREWVERNTQKNSYHQTLIDQLDSNQSASEIQADYFAVGDDTSVAILGGGLGNEIARYPVGGSTDNGTSVDIEASLSESDASGNTITEVGLVDDSNSQFINRIRLSTDINKTDSTTASFTFTLEWEQEEDVI